MPTAIDKERWKAFFEKVMPAAAIAHCVQCFAETPVSVTVTRKRTSKWGDYRIRPARPPHITVNRDLPPPFFLLTLLHELAHHRVHLRFGLRRTLPHGKEWKIEFALLMNPLLVDAAVFGDALTPVLIRHMKSPKANVASDQRLHEIYLSMVDVPGVRLDTLVSGTTFTFRGRSFSVGERVRKRIACCCSQTKRTYLFQPVTRVEVSAVLSTA